MGVFTLLVMLVIFFLYASHSIDLCRSHYWLILGSSLVALLGILQFYHIDPVGFSLHVPDQYNGMYISTIGQINTFSGYIALTLAFTLSFYCLRGNRWLLLPSFIGFLALFIGNSDSGFLSLFTVIFLLPLFLPNQTAFCRLFDQLLLFNLTGLIAGGLSPFGLIPYQGFSARFSGFHFALPCLTAMGLLRLWIPHMRYPQAARFRPKRLYAFFLVTAILLFFLLTLCVNIGLIQCSPLLINDQWGSFRGFIWLKIIKIFQNAPLLNKLFGYGPDTLKPLLLTLCREEMLAITGKIYDSAHNDFLHYLITTGLSGSLTWLFFWFSVVIHTSRHYTQELLPWYLALIAYLVQTLLIPTQPITAPLGFLFAGICIGNSRTSSDCTKKRICHRIFRVL